MARTSSSLRHIKTGFLERHSAKMHPTDHMSTPRKYCSAPKIISGARYHNETIALLFLLYKNEAFLARPKSANLSYPFLSMRILSGLISRCMIIFACRISTAVSKSLISFLVLSIGRGATLLFSSWESTLSQNSNTQCTWLFREDESSTMSKRRTN